MPRLSESRFEENFPGSEYSAEEREFFVAMERYKRLTRRKFPTWHEVLRVFKSLGYERIEPAAPQPATLPHSE